MESRKIEIITTSNGKYHWLNFQGIDNLLESIQLDRWIYNNLDKHLNFAKINNIKYTNLQEVEKYCEQFLRNNSNKFAKTAYQYVIDHVEEDISNRKELKDLIIKIESYKKTYLMKDNHNGLYKIGFSKNPEFRESTLQSEKPSIKMVKTWDKDIEKHLHKEYSKNRVRGEWFDLTKVQVRYICTHY